MCCGRTSSTAGSCGKKENKNRRLLYCSGCRNDIFPRHFRCNDVFRSGDQGTIFQYMAYPAVLIGGKPVLVGMEIVHDIGRYKTFSFTSVSCEYFLCVRFGKCIQPFGIGITVIIGGNPFRCTLARRIRGITPDSVPAHELKSHKCYPR